MFEFFQIFYSSSDLDLDCRRWYIFFAGHMYTGVFVALFGLGYITMGNGFTCHLLNDNSGYLCYSRTSLLADFSVHILI